MEEVYVVTNFELGWDNVCGVFGSLESLKDYFKERFDVKKDSTEDDLFTNLNEEDFKEAVYDINYAYYIQTLRVQ